MIVEIANALNRETKALIDGIMAKASPPAELVEHAAASGHEWGAVIAFALGVAPAIGSYYCKGCP